MSNNHRKTPVHLSEEQKLNLIISVNEFVKKNPLGEDEAAQTAAMKLAISLASKVFKPAESTIGGFLRDKRLKSKAANYFRKNGSANAPVLSVESVELFTPGEELIAKLHQEEIAREKENAAILPGDFITTRRFETQCVKFQTENIREVFPHPSPPKKSRAPLIDLTNHEVSVVDGTMSGRPTMSEYYLLKFL